MTLILFIGSCQPGLPKLRKLTWRNCQLQNISVYQQISQTSTTVNCAFSWIKCIHNDNLLNALFCYSCALISVSMRDRERKKSETGEEKRARQKLPHSPFPLRSLTPLTPAKPPTTAELSKVTDMCFTMSGKSELLNKILMKSIKC